MSLLFMDANVIMSANKISDNIPISKSHNTDSEALELFACLWTHHQNYSGETDAKGGGGKNHICHGLR